MQNYQDVNSQYHQTNKARNLHLQKKQEYLSVTRPEQDDAFNLECDADISEF